MTQQEIVIDQLKSFGQISRNWCLQHYITRLGAIIERLNKRGWQISGRYRTTENGSDFVYRVIKAQNDTKPRIVEIKRQILPNSARVAELNAQLYNIQAKIKPSWDNYQILRDIKEALRSTNVYKKEAIIKMTVDKY